MVKGSQIMYESKLKLLPSVLLELHGPVQVAHLHPAESDHLLEQVKLVLAQGNVIRRNQIVKVQYAATAGSYHRSSSNDGGESALEVWFDSRTMTEAEWLDLADAIGCNVMGPTTSTNKKGRRLIELHIASEGKRQLQIGKTILRKPAGVASARCHNLNSETCL
jgi:hypothetical protein